MAASCLRIKTLSAQFVMVQLSWSNGASYQQGEAGSGLPPLRKLSQLTTAASRTQLSSFNELAY